MNGRACRLAAIIPTAAALLAYSAATAHAEGHIPAQYHQALATAPLSCGHGEVTAELIAAHMQADSNWDQFAQSPAGALGPAQMFPDVFAVYGADDDGDGVASPFDIADAVNAAVRVDCAIVTQLKSVGHSADPVSIISAYIGGMAGVDAPHVREQAIGIWTHRPALPAGTSS